MFKVFSCFFYGLSILFDFSGNLNKLSIKYQSYVKSTKIDTFEQKIDKRHSPTN